MSGAVPLAQQIVSARHELGTRRRLYPKWVAEGRMKAEDAERRIAEMAAIVETLQRLNQPEPGL